MELDRDDDSAQRVGQAWPTASRAGLSRAGVVLLAACVAVLAWHAGLGLRTTRQLTSGWWHDRAAATERQFGCLSERLAELVPAGSTVHVESSAGETWRQRAVELAAERAQLADRAADADLTIRVAPAPSPSSCDGVALSRVP